MERAPDADEDRAVVEATEWLMAAAGRRRRTWLCADASRRGARPVPRTMLHGPNCGISQRSPRSCGRPLPDSGGRSWQGGGRSARRARRTRCGRARPRAHAASSCRRWLQWRPVSRCFAAPPMLLQLQADHVTSTAEQRSIELPDGSRVTLAPASAIAVSYVAAERRVDLLSGEAFFQVQPNADRPFRVTARTVQATVAWHQFRRPPRSVRRHGFRRGRRRARFVGRARRESGGRRAVRASVVRRRRGAGERKRRNWSPPGAVASSMPRTSGWAMPSTSSAATSAARSSSPTMPLPTNASPAPTTSPTPSRRCAASPRRMALRCAASRPGCWSCRAGDRQRSPDKFVENPAERLVAFMRVRMCGVRIARR